MESKIDNIVLEIKSLIESKVKDPEIAKQEFIGFMSEVSARMLLFLGGKSEEINQENNEDPEEAIANLLTDLKDNPELMGRFLGRYEKELELLLEDLKEALK